MANLRHEDVCTLLKNDDDKDILTRKLFNVNMRLFETSSGYRKIVQQAAMYIRDLAATEREGYKKPHGFSGANAGIPFNIIALADGTIMINPEIIGGIGICRSLSNCGSLLLEKPIEINRYEWIKVQAYDLDGRRIERSGKLLTVQHEVDHNNGILITDRRA